MSRYWRVEACDHVGGRCLWRRETGRLDTLAEALDGIERNSKQHPECHYRVVKIVTTVVATAIKLRAAQDMSHGMCRASFCRGWADKNRYSLCTEHLGQAERFGVIVDGQVVPVKKEPG